MSSPFDVPCPRLLAQREDVFVKFNYSAIERMKRGEMEPESRDFTYNGTTYHIVARRKNKHRRDVRRITRLLEKAGIEDDGSEFAAIVVYSTGAKGKGWTPPKATAPDDTLIAGFYEWEEQDSALTDAFMVAIYQSSSDPVTSPIPLDESADPN